MKLSGQIYTFWNKPLSLPQLNSFYIVDILFYDLELCPNMADRRCVHMVSSQEDVADGSTNYIQNLLCSTNLR